MRKTVLIFAAIILTLTMCMASFAAPVAPNGITTTPVRDFTGLEDGETTFSQLGFWTASGDPTATVSNGTITIKAGDWGAYQAFTEEEVNALKSADGLGFYVAAGEAGGIIGCGFNTAASVNCVLGVDKTAYLVDKDGKVTEAKTYFYTNTNQGVIDIPANFAGYAYFPYDLFVVNDGSGTPFDSSAETVATLIFSTGTTGNVTYGEIYAFNGAYTPGDSGEGDKDPSGDEGDLSMIAYAAAAVAGLGAVTFIRKKK